MPTPKEMAVDAPEKREPVNPCCEKWIEKRNALRKAVMLYERGFADAEKARTVAEKARADAENAGKNEVSAIRVSLENEISNLKSEISLLRQKGGLAANNVEEATLLQKRISERDSEIIHLKELVENAEAEKRKAAEALKAVKSEKIRADKEKRLANVERKKAEEYRVKLNLVKKEADEAKSKLVLATTKLEESAIRQPIENEITDQKSEISLLRQKGGFGAHHGDEEVAQLKERISEGEKEINRLKEVLEYSEAEKRKASEACKALEAGKIRADDEKRLAAIEQKKAEEYRLQLNSSRKEADEAKRKLVLATSKLEEANRKLEAQKMEVVREKKRKDSKKAKAKGQTKLLEADGKKIIKERRNSDLSSWHFKDDSQKFEELQKQVCDCASSQKMKDATSTDKRMLDKITKSKDRLQSATMKKGSDREKMVSEFLISEEVAERLESEKRKAIREKKRADSMMEKAEEQRKLAEANRMKATEEKSRADQLSQLLGEKRRRFEDIRKKINELVLSRAETPVVPPGEIMTYDSDIAKMKLLKEELKLERMRVKHAKKVAKLEKAHNTVLQQELGYLKQEYYRISHRLNFLDNCFSCGIEGTDNLTKTGEISNMQNSSLKGERWVIKPFQMHFQCENELLKTACRTTDPCDCFGQSRMTSGIDSQLGSPFGGSDRKMLQSSAINSSMATFSDSQLVGSQENGEFSVTTTANLESMNLQQAISKFPGQVTKTRQNENLTVEAENSAGSTLKTDVVETVNGHGEKRKRIRDTGEFIEYLYREGKKSHLQIEKKKSLLHNTLNKQVYNPLEEKSTACDLGGDSYANFHGFHKKRKPSHKPKEVMWHLVDGDEQRKIDKTKMGGSDNENLMKQAKHPGCHITGGNLVCRNDEFGSLNMMGINQGCKDVECDSVMTEQEAVVSIGEVADGDYMKLLDLDDVVDEECYKMAREVPLSPTLPEIRSESGGESAGDTPELILEEMVYDRLSMEKEHPVPRSFDVIDVEINSNSMEFEASGTSHDSLLHENVGDGDTFRGQGNKMGLCTATFEEKGFFYKNWGSDMGVDNTSKMSGSADEEPKYQYGSELKPRHDSFPEFCVVFPDTKDRGSISRMLRATRNCIARCDLFSHSDWVVQKILRATVIEDLLPRDKVCVFFSLLLYNFLGAASKNFGDFLTNPLTCCVDSFGRHIHSVISDVEARNILLELFCSDELLRLILDFLIDGRVLVYTNLSSLPLIVSESSLDDTDMDLSWKTASNDQLVAGSIILASIGVALDEIGVICEASYNILLTRRFESSLVLTILHIFAHLCGEKYFSLGSYSLMMAVIKSIVTHLERIHISVGTGSLPVASEVRPEFPPCSKCPFSEEAVSVDAVTSLLLEELQNYALLGNLHQDLMESVKSIDSTVLLNEEKSIQSSSHESACGVFDMKFDVPCCLRNFGMLITQSDSANGGSLCHCIDVLSLIELITCKLSWAWSCEKIIPKLWNILETCALENVSAAIIVLLGQLGRHEVEAKGYEESGVENLRSRIIAFLCGNDNIKMSLPIQIATVSALLGLLPVDFKTLIRGDVELPGIINQPGFPDLIRKWFSLLSTDQQCSSFSALQSNS